MAISKHYNPENVEEKWYQYWQAHNFFHSEPDPEKTPYSIVIPPPNVTGVLHMGHILNNTIQDVLIRKARMEGREACWVPGTDHASIATEAKVVNMLKEKGIDKNTISREAFLEYAWEWKEKYGGIILQQLKKLGCSCDWQRTRFTMEQDLSDSVIKVFVQLYEEGLIYRGARMINWDPAGRTAISDEEVNYKEENSKLYYIQYPIKGTDDYIPVATTRPETLLGDVAVCINPNDTRYGHLIGKTAVTPIVNREIPVISDEYVDMTFGTGCLKITPAHDINDYNIGLKHELPVIDVLDENGRLNENAGAFIGEDRFDAREKVVEELEKHKLLEKTENITNNVGRSERTDAVIEPKISTQWFVNMQPLAQPALEHVLNENIRLFPDKFINMYRSWMENVQDWCISRQLWWGHRIPAYYLDDGSYVVAETPEAALEKAREKTGNNNLSPDELKQDEDVLDTWFSSWLWPITVFNGIKEPGNKDYKYYYPTKDLVTAPDILFFWVARMIMAGYKFAGERPFRNVYLTGMVRDSKGRKMSKSLGNSPDPEELMSKYGADGVRVGMMFSAPAGNDLLFEERLCEQGRNFANKIWNALRLIKSWETEEKPQQEEEKTAIAWFESRFQEINQQLEDHYEKFRISAILMAIYKLIWDDFCAWYLEAVKPAKGALLARSTYDQTIFFFEELMKILHPFMPFLTEEVWHNLKNRNERDAITIASYPGAGSKDDRLIEEMQLIMNMITETRNIRNKNQIAQKKELQLMIKTPSKEVFSIYIPFIKKLANIAEIEFVNEGPQNAASFVLKDHEFYIPLEAAIDHDSEKQQLMQDLDYTRGFLESVNKKLSNEKFVQNAKPEIVENERKKKADAESKIAALEKRLQEFYAY